MTQTNSNLKGNNYAAPPRLFFDAVKVCWRKCFDFNGRASRSEFWWFYLFTMAFSLAAERPMYVLWRDVRIAEILSSVIFLAILFPTLSAGARRLHDSNLSGWWQLFIYGPYIPAIPSLFVGVDPVMLKLNLHFPMTEYLFWYGIWIFYLFSSFFAYIYLFARKGCPVRNRYDRKR